VAVQKSLNGIMITAQTMVKLLVDQFNLRVRLASGVRHVRSTICSFVF